MNTHPLSVLCAEDQFMACVHLANARLRLWLPDKRGVKLIFEVANEKYAATVERLIAASYEVITYGLHTPST